MERTTEIITSRYYKTVCSVVRGTQAQIAALLAQDPQAFGFKAYRPSDWDYRGEVIDLSVTGARQAALDITRGKAALPADSRWLAR